MFFKTIFLTIFVFISFCGISAESPNKGDYQEVIDEFESNKGNEAFSPKKEMEYQKFMAQLKKVNEQSKKPSKSKPLTIIENGNTRASFFDCDGNPQSSDVFISPKNFPSGFAEKNATIKFDLSGTKNTSPSNISLISGSPDVYDWVKKSLSLSHFSRDVSMCWLIEYDYKNS